ncbi:MAG: NYN domain-containing protein [Pseudomonadota bacterium]
MADERPLLAVLIDADNVPARHAEAILKEVSLIGEPALRRVYGDWSSDSLKGWAKSIPSLGLVARQETANTKQKNASDIGLVIDAMDILHTSKFDGFVLVSSDSDFTALANRLREDGLTVIGIGESKTPDSLRNVCNRFILIENLTADEKTEASAPKAKGKLSEAYELFIEAMNRIDTEDEWYNLGGVGSMILAAHPDFDPRSYGHAKLSGLAKALRDLETKASGNNLLIRLRS